MPANAAGIETEAASIPTVDMLPQGSQQEAETAEAAQTDDAAHVMPKADGPGVEVPAEPSMQPATSPIRAYDPPLAEIGFGPGMLIRLSQLGLYTTGDLAQADAAHLRVALGDISRLVDVEAWIASAQQTTGMPSA